jgi:hypothetical protein
VVLTTANFGGFSNFCRYYTRSQAGKSTGYRPTLKPLPIFFKANSIHSSIVAILELIRGMQCLIEVIRSSGKKMWRVDAYQIPYYSRGIEEAKRTDPRFADCKNCLWWPCLLPDRNKMNNLYRGPSIDDSYQVSVHLAKQFQRRKIKKKNWPIRNKNCLWRPCLLIDWDKMSNF